METLVRRLHRGDGIVGERFNRLDDLLRALVGLACEIQRACAKGTHERADFLVDVHGLDVFT